MAATNKTIPVSGPGTASAAETRTIDNNQNLSAETKLAELLSGSVYMPAPVRRNVNFSGSDVEAYIMAYGSISKETFIPLINLAAISCSVHRDKSPVRRLGESAAKAYTKGTRTVAGSIVLVNFDRAGFYELIASQLVGQDFNLVYGNTSALGGDIAFADDIPPFDIMLLFKEERSFSDKGFRGGNLGPLSGRPTEETPKRIVSKMMIKEVHLVDEGVVTGTDEAYLETTFQYVAEDLEYLRPMDDPDITAPAKIETPSTATVKVEPAIPYRLFGHEDPATGVFSNDQRAETFNYETITEAVNLLFWADFPETFTGTFGGDYATNHVDGEDNLLGAITRIPGTCSNGDTTSTNQKDCEDADEGGGAGTWTETVELLNGKVANYVGDPAAVPQVQPSIPSEPWKASNVYIRPLKPIPPYFDDPDRVTTLKDFTISANPSDKWIVEDNIINFRGKYKIQSGSNENSEVFYDDAAIKPAGEAGTGGGYDYVISSDGASPPDLANEQIDGEDARFLILKNAYLNDPGALQAEADAAEFFDPLEQPGEGGTIEGESHWEVNKFGVHEFFNIKGPKYEYKTECTDSAVCNFGAPKYGLNLGLGKYYFELDSIPISVSVLGDPLSDYIEASSPIGKHLIEKVAAVDPADDFVYKDDPVTEDNLVRVTLGGSDVDYAKDADILQTANIDISYTVPRDIVSVTESTLSGTCSGGGSSGNETTQIECEAATGAWAVGTIDGVGNNAELLMYFDLNTSLDEPSASGPLMTAAYIGDTSLSAADKIEEVKKNISVKLQDWTATGGQVELDITDKIDSFVHNGFIGATGSKKDNSKIGILIPGIIPVATNQVKQRDITGGAVDGPFIFQTVDGLDSEDGYDIETAAQKMSISQDTVTIHDQLGAQTGVYANLSCTDHVQNFNTAKTTFTVEGFENNISATETTNDVLSGYGPAQDQDAIEMTGQLTSNNTIVVFPGGADPHESITEIIGASFTDNILNNYLAVPLKQLQIDDLALATQDNGRLNFLQGQSNVVISGVHDPISTAGPVHTVCIDQAAWTAVINNDNKIKFDIKTSNGTNVADHYDYFVGGWFGNSKAYFAHTAFSACDDTQWATKSECVSAGTCIGDSTYDNNPQQCVANQGTFTSDGNTWESYPAITIDDEDKRSVTVLGDNSGIEIDVSDITEKIQNIGSPIYIHVYYDFKYTDVAQVNVSYKQHVDNSSPPIPANTFDYEITLNPTLNPTTFAHYTLAESPSSFSDKVTVSSANDPEGVFWALANIEDTSTVDNWKFKIKNIPLLDEPHTIVIDYKYKWTSVSTNNIPIAVHYKMYNFDPNDVNLTQKVIDFGAHQPLYLDNNGDYQNWDWNEIKAMTTMTDINWTNYLEIRCKNSQGILPVIDMGNGAIVGADGTNPITVSTPAYDNSTNTYKSTVSNIPLGVVQDAAEWWESMWDGIWGSETSPQGNLEITVSSYSKNTSGRAINMQFEVHAVSPQTHTWGWEYTNTAPHNLGVNLLWDYLAKQWDYRPHIDYFSFTPAASANHTIAISPKVTYDENSVGDWHFALPWADPAYPLFINENIRQITITNVHNATSYWNNLNGADIANVQIFDGSNYANSPLDKLDLIIQHVPMISDTIEFRIQFTWMLDPLQLTLKYLSDSGTYWNDMPINGTFAVETEVPVLVTPKVTRDSNGAVIDSTGSFSYNLDIIKSVDFVSVDGSTRKEGISLQPFNEGLVDAHDGAWCRADISEFTNPPTGATSNLEDKDGTELRQLVYRSGLDPILSTDADTLYGLQYSHYANVTSTSTDAYKLEVTYEYITEYEPALIYTKPGYVMTARINAENVNWDATLPEKYRKDWELAIDIPTKTIYLNDGEYWQAGHCTNAQYDAQQNSNLVDKTKYECLTQAEYCSDSQWDTKVACGDAGTCAGEGGGSPFSDNQADCVNSAVNESIPGAGDGAGTWTSDDNIWYGKNTWSYPEIDELVCKSLDGKWERDPSGMYTPPGNITNEDLEVAKGQCTVDLDSLAETYQLIMWGFWLIGSKDSKDSTGLGLKMFVNPERYGTIREAIANMQLEYQKQWGGSFCTEQIKNNSGVLEQFNIKRNINNKADCEQAGFIWLN